jgi:hypothetical protein
MNASNFGGEMRMKYRRDKEVDLIRNRLIAQSFYISGDRDSGKCEQAYLVQKNVVMTIALSNFLSIFKKRLQPW